MAYSPNDRTLSYSAQFISLIIQGVPTDLHKWKLDGSNDPRKRRVSRSLGPSHNLRSIRKHILPYLRHHIAVYAFHQKPPIPSIDDIILYYLFRIHPY